MNKRNASRKPPWYEEIVARPPLATVLVGSSILLLSLLIRLLAREWPALAVLLWVAPFVPPFFITRIARRITLRRAEFHFIEDAEPIIFLAHLKKPSLQALLEARPVVVSRGARRYLNMSAETLLESPLLPPEKFAPSTRETVFRRLLEQVQQQGQACLPPTAVQGCANRTGQPHDYVLTAVLKKQTPGWKVQLTLMPVP
ncbi:MAG: hypothetical protein D6715_03660 [Calditrichaeota bacterium]|nr:MAG: hypothetical protein D6715_03660 [Calditrichota bacterium]